MGSRRAASASSRKAVGEFYVRARLDSPSSPGIYLGLNDGNADAGREVNYQREIIFYIKVLD